MESTNIEPARDGIAGGAAAAAITTDAVDANAVAVVPPPAPFSADDADRPSATSVGLWGPTGHGKTQLAASITSDPGYAPAMYIDLDAGRPALAGYEAADLIVYRPAAVIADVVKHMREVQAGRCFNRAGKRVRTVIIDAVSNLIPNEINRLGLGAAKPQDQALAIISPFNVLFGQLRSLPRDYNITVVHVAHSKNKSVKVNDVVTDLMIPAMFRSIADPWMASVRHLWRITKKRGTKGPAFPAMMLRTEHEGVTGTATYVPFMKTSNIAFAQWIAGEMGKREWLEWDTGTLPVDQHPTLAYLLRVADDLAFEQGKFAVANPSTLRALSALEAVMQQSAAA